MAPRVATIRTKRSLPSRPSAAMPLLRSSASVSWTLERILLLILVLSFGINFLFRAPGSGYLPSSQVGRGSRGDMQQLLAALEGGRGGRGDGRGGDWIEGLWGDELRGVGSGKRKGKGKGEGKKRKATKKKKLPMEKLRKLKEQQRRIRRRLERPARRQEEEEEEEEEGEEADRDEEGVRGGREGREEEETGEESTRKEGEGGEDEGEEGDDSEEGSEEEGEGVVEDEGDLGVMSGGEVEEEGIEGESMQEREEREEVNRDFKEHLKSHMERAVKGSQSDSELFQLSSHPPLLLRPCLGFSPAFRNTSLSSLNSGLYLLAVVTGGLNQMRLQIGNAVIIARVLRSALVVPVLQENAIWKDKSEFADMFDVAHFKQTLRHDVRIITALPSHYLRTRPEEVIPPMGSTPKWIRDNFGPLLRRDHVLLIRGLDQAISPDLPLNLQRLRCKVEFHALQFIQPIRELGSKLVERMAQGGPYVALHLRLEKDVWIRTGCSPHLGADLDLEIQRLRSLKPELLTGRNSLSPQERFAAGQCPMTAKMVARLLLALGASNATRVFVAGGEAFGAELALRPLHLSFSSIETKESLARPGELQQFASQANVLAALDFIVSASSDLFLPSHGGNMAHVIQGHRSYFGQRRVVIPSKKKIIEAWGLSDEEFSQQMKAVHGNSSMASLSRLNNQKKDVIALPFPECLCHPRRSQDKL